MRFPLVTTFPVNICRIAKAAREESQELPAGPFRSLGNLAGDQYPLLYVEHSMPETSWRVSWHVLKCFEKSGHQAITPGWSANRKLCGYWRSSPLRSKPVPDARGNSFARPMRRRSGIAQLRFFLHNRRYGSHRFPARRECWWTQNVSP